MAMSRQVQGKDALAAFQKTTELLPNDAGAHLNLGNALQDARRLEEAIQSFQQALLIKPNFAEAHNNLGSAYIELRQFENAMASYRHAVLAKPDFAAAHCSLGNVLHHTGQLDEAATSYRRAIKAQPIFVEAYSNLGAVLRDLGQFDASIASYEQALAIQPNYPEINIKLGVMLRDIGQLGNAAVCFQRELLIQPNDEKSLSNLGLTQLMLGKFDKAEINLRHAISIDPNSVEVNNNLGLTLYSIGQYKEAELCFRKALQLRPDYAEAYNNLANTQKDSGEINSALISYQQALTLNPSFTVAYNNIAGVFLGIGDISSALENYRRAIQLKPDYFNAHSSLLFCLNYNLIQSEDYLAEARCFGENVSQKVTARFDTWQCNPSPERLRVGIVSADLSHHPVGYFTESLLTQLVSSRIELIAYPTQPKEDDLTARIKPRFSAWKTLVGLSDQAAAQLIHNDGVHVLLDLSGHTAKNRLPVFAWKPAPVQCTWLGLPTTTGVAEMDYVLGDPIATPPEDASHFSEQIWRLPETYICLSVPEGVQTVATLPALRNGFITFASFNNLAKMNDATVALWARILKAIPTSRLLLKTKQLKDQSILSATLQRFVVHDIDIERLTLEGPTEQRTNHLENYHRVDIGLDPYPYPGVTTSAEALWMGVPVLSMQGDRFMSRTAASIAYNAGLPDWVARNEDDYVAKAIQFSQDIPRLAVLREGLREQVRLSPLFDAPRFAKNFEEALWGMWQVNMQDSFGANQEHSE
jgi:predicted O-linked N-acetylglucosamine transferase (SPINDLY family)